MKLSQNYSFWNPEQDKVFIQMQNDEKEYIQTCADFFTKENKADIFLRCMERCKYVAKITEVHSWHDLMSQIIQDIRTNGNIKDSKWIVG